MSTINYKDPSLLSTVSTNGIMSSVDKGNIVSLTNGLENETIRDIAAEFLISDSLDGYSTIIDLEAEVARAEASEA